MLTVRLSPEIQKELDELVERKHLSRSELVKIALQEYLARENADNPYELGKDLFGQYGSIAAESPDEPYQHTVKKKIDEKHSH